MSMPPLGWKMVLWNSVRLPEPICPHRLDCSAEDEEEGEEEVTVDPEKMNDAMTLLRTVKPVIAGIKDSKTRKQVSDAFAKALKMSIGTNEQYGQMMTMARMSAKDSMSKQQQGWLSGIHG